MFTSGKTFPVDYIAEKNQSYQKTCASYKQEAHAKMDLNVSGYDVNDCTWKVRCGDQLRDEPFDFVGRGGGNGADANFLLI